MLVLVPAGFLVLVLLGALAVDSAVAYQAQQKLHDELAAAATDAVSAGVSRPSFYGSGTVSLDPAAVDEAICRSMAAQGGTDLRGLRVSAVISGRTLQVTGSATVNGVFGRAVPGFGTRSVHATAQATLESAATASAPVVAAPPEPLDC